MSTEIRQLMSIDCNDIINVSSPAKKKFKSDIMHPAEELMADALTLGSDVNSLTFAMYMDDADPLSYLRDEFYYPKNSTLIGIDLMKVDLSEDCIYFCGNSLGLQPATTGLYIQRELEKWAKVGVQGHLNGELPWAFCDEKVNGRMSKLVGAEEEEVQLMNALTINLHLLLTSFYRPTPMRYKVLLESRAFPSDHYAIESQIRLHGNDPKSSMICLEPRSGEYTLRTEDILERIEAEGDSIALICFSGVQYLTGQLFDIAAITHAGHQKGCYVGFDLAHAVGNVELNLHEWDVDFAVWCTYKYLNAGAGGIGGAFLHNKHKHNEFPKLLGWWGHEFETRFNMDNEMQLSTGINGYRVSNPSPLLCCPLLASFDVFDKTSMGALREKSKKLTAYLEMLLLHNFPKLAVEEGSEDQKERPYIEILTPTDPDQRGCQLSVRFSIPIHQVFKELTKRGVVCDKREPDIVRLAPTPLYNRYEDVFNFIQLLAESLYAAEKS